MRGRDAVALVAGREIRTRLREKALRISTLVTVLLLAGVVLLPKLLDSGGPKKATVVAAPGKALSLAQSATRAPRDAGVEVTVKQVGSDTAARRQVRDGDADAAVVDGGRKLVAGDPRPDEAIALLQALAANAPPLPVEDTVSSEDDQQRQLAFVAVLLLYVQLIGYGFWVASGIVEEKASRIVELLLAAIKPRELLAGKVLGIGVVALGQLLLLGAVGLGLGFATGTVAADARSVGSLGIVLAWFLLGYAFYACAFAVAASLVARQEDIQNVTTPVTLVLLAAFFLAFAALDDPGGTLAQVVSFLPPAAPLIMPARMIAGDVGVLTVLASALLMLVAIAALVVLAGRIYEAGVLQTRKVRLVDALRRESTAPAGGTRELP